MLDVILIILIAAELVVAGFVTRTITREFRNTRDKLCRRLSTSARRQAST